MAESVPSSPPSAPPAAHGGDQLDVSVVVPVRDEAGSLDELVRRLVEVLTAAGRSFEILLVDDGSTDGSTREIERLCASRPALRAIVFRRNFGKAQALDAGFRFSRGRLVFTIDADLQDQPEEIPRFLAKIDEGCDVVSGWKKERRDPWTKRLPSKLFNWILSLLMGRTLHDFNCGFKCYRREVIEDIRLYGELHRYAVVLAHARGFRVAEIPVQHRSRNYGRSKYGVERLPKGFFDLLTVLLTTRYSDRPLHFFGGVGLSMFFAGALILAWISLRWFFGHPIAGRPLFFLGILLVIVGGQVISTGLLAEVFIKARVRDRAEYSVQRVINL